MTRSLSSIEPRCLHLSTPSTVSCRTRFWGDSFYSLEPHPSSTRRRRMRFKADARHPLRVLATGMPSQCSELPPHLCSKGCSDSKGRDVDVSQVSIGQGSHL